MRYLHIADVEIVVSEYRAAHRADQNGAVLHAEFGKRFGNQFVGDAVSATRAVMRLLLQFGLAIVFVVERRRFFVNYLIAFHNLSPKLHHPE